MSSHTESFISCYGSFYSTTVFKFACLQSLHIFIYILKTNLSLKVSASLGRSQMKSCVFGLVRRDELCRVSEIDIQISISKWLHDFRHVKCRTLLPIIILWVILPRRTLVECVPNNPVINTKELFYLWHINTASVVEKEQGLECLGFLILKIYF